MKIRIPTSKASVALATEDSDKLYAPSASRNSEALCEVVSAIAPENGDALEIASGTGQHIIAFANSMPALTWQPSEVEQARIRSIESYVSESGLTNISKPIRLNASQTGWGEDIGPKDLICIGKFVSSDQLAKAKLQRFLKESAHALKPTGHLCVYGPFKRDGEFTSDGDVSFDADIRATDPEVGYKDDAWIKSVAEDAGLAFVNAHEMPANNLVLILRKP